MKLSSGFNPDLFKRLVLWPIIGLGATLALTLVVYDRVLKDTGGITQSPDKLQRQVKQLQQQYQWLNTYGEQFSEPKLQGMIQPLNRIEWTDFINQWNQAWLSNGLTLQFAAEQKLSAAELKQLGLTQPIYFVTRVQLGLRLQTEQDFVRLIDDLRQRFYTPFWLEKCELDLIRRGIGVQAQFNPQQGNVRMQCTLAVLRAEPRPFNPQEWR